ncbi:hypothetical protein CDAR_260561 [Caerostris darwini]|uniref:Uncharacterized protein n=1 Tax=Caerostris darwini TaxID=1538125 RepID=A0AAV4NPC1_9ARAC|nr:hypothetical protein CDAR_260561 [Caerostris darwini]
MMLNLPDGNQHHRAEVIEKMEVYFDNDGKLLRCFYKEPKSKIAKSFLLTVVDCTCCMATWSLAVYLVFLKALFVLGCGLLFPIASPRPSPAISPKEKGGQRSGKTSVQMKTEMEPQTECPSEDIKSGSDSETELGVLPDQSGKTSIRPSSEVCRKLRVLGPAANIPKLLICRKRDELLQKDRRILTNGFLM